MRGLITAKPRRQSPTKGDPFAFVRDAELRGPIAQLDDVHDALMGQALGGDNGCYELALTVRSATDFLFELREKRNNGESTAR